VWKAVVGVYSTKLPFFEASSMFMTYICKILVTEMINNRMLALQKYAISYSIQYDEIYVIII
jgi:hypothetical protein